MNRKILFVDDDPMILSGFERTLRKQFEVFTALGAERAFEVIRSSGPFAVIVSDYSMPGMNGVQFLAKCREDQPDTVRIIFTGRADIETTIKAVNEGNIFRFLVKPCHYEVMIVALEAALRQYELVIAERELLDKTLKGSVKVLIETLTLSNSLAFTRTSRICRWLRPIATRLKVTNQPELELAGMLSQIGCIALPQALLEKKEKGEPIVDKELELYNAHPRIGRNLLNRIPRLEKIADAVDLQLKRFDGSGPPLDRPLKGADIPLFSRLLLVANDFDSLVQSGMNEADAAQRLAQSPEIYDPSIIEALLGETRKFEKKVPPKRVTVEELVPGMIFPDPIVDRKGFLIISQGLEVSDIVKTRLEYLVATNRIDNSFKVIVPHEAEGTS